MRHVYTYPRDRGQKLRPQPLSEQERKALVKEALRQAEEIIAQAFRLAPMSEVMLAQLRVRELVVKEAARRNVKAARSKSK